MKVHEVQITDDENDDYGTGAMLIYFRVAAWKKVGYHTYKLEKKIMWAPWKDLGICYPKKISGGTL